MMDHTGLTQVSSMGTVEVEEEEDRVIQYFGYVKGNIVGIRYYSGMVSNKEMVAFCREPHNPYDANAVRVNNIRGEQVGHIKREMARALAPIVDRGFASIEGLVPFGSNNTYSMPVEISFWGEPENKEKAIRIMRGHGYQMIEEVPRTEKPPPGSGRGKRSAKYLAARSRATIITADQMKSELDELFEKLEEVDQTAEEDACSAVKSTLYRHQKQALAWMRKRESGGDLPPFWEERSPDAKVAAKAQGQTVYYNTVTNFSTTKEPKRVKGGILADDMGLGKTLITISLILGNTWNGEPLHKLNESESQGSEVIDLTGEEIVVEKVEVEEAEVPKINVVLEVESADAVVMGRPRRATKRPAKYVDEPDIEEAVDDPSVLPKKKKSRSSKADKQDKEYHPCPDENIANGAAAGVGKLEDDLLRFDKDQAPSEKPHGTLIVCPLSLISNWVDQVTEHVHVGAEVEILVYHGATKAQVTKKLINQYDIVITTYQTLANELKKSSNGKLHSIEWLRVVLDEGHIVRNPKAQQSKACYALKAQRKWVLTGTPIQNSVKDLWSIISFLGIEPFTDAQWWRRTIERPINDGDVNALKRIRCLLGTICMRRTKQQKVNGKPIISIPDKQIFVQRIDLTDKERDAYTRMDKAGKQAMQRYINEGIEATKYADVLVMLMRLRQICCHIGLAKEAIEALQQESTLPAKIISELATKLMCILESGSVEECCVCLDALTMPVITRCAHVFCRLCICGVIANQRDNPRCPLCRGVVREEDLVEAPSDPDESQEMSSDIISHSSKVDALMHELIKLQEEQPTVKCLVVSQFTEYLKIIEKHLVESNIPSVLYHGGMAMKARDAAVHQLKQGPVKVMLLALKAGGVGLNLTAASHVYLMEPAWNPATEDQCFDRVHRLGQTKPVKIVKFICSETVEERIVQLQNRKREIAKASLQRRSAEERKQQTVSDLRQLMDM